MAHPAATGVYFIGNLKLYFPISGSILGDLKAFKRYALLALATLLAFPGGVVPIAVVGSLDVKEVGFLPWLGLLIFVGAPLGVVIASLSFVVFQLANDKYPAPKGVVNWFDNLKASLNRAGRHLGKSLGFLMVVGFALAVASATGWYDLFDPEKTTEEWPWYNFLALILGGAFSAYLIYHAIKFLGQRD